MTTVRPLFAAAFAAMLLVPAATGLAQEDAAPATEQAQPQDQRRQDQQRQDQQQQDQQQQDQRREQSPARPRADAGLRLPPAAVITRTLAAGGERRDYRVTAGAIVLRNDAGEPQVEVGYLAYTLVGEEAPARPLTFAFNGGPGAASAYLNFGALGPQRLSFGNPGEGPSAPPVLVDNPETWLDFTDLVFIDPVGTGFSRFVSDNRELRRSVWSVDGDISTLASVIRRYLTENDRWISPKFLVGESYGGFRVPKLAARLQKEEGVGISGIVMISPVLDFTTQSDSDGAPLSFVARLPSLAALALQRRGEPVTRAALADVESYARGDFVVDFLRGPGDRAAVERIVERVTAFTGLDHSFVANQAGRLDIMEIARALGRASESVASLYDASVLGLHPLPFVLSSRPDDPILHASIAPLTSVAVDFITRTVGWRVDAPYRLLSDEVNRGWSWGAGRHQLPEAVSDLRQALALDPALKALVVHGATDLVTPYFDSQLIIDRLTPLGATAGSRVALEVFKGGHMFYSDEASRAALTAAARTLYPPR